MNFPFSLKSIVLFVLVTFSSFQSVSQCFEIETILVDACADSGDEGFNEMVRFRIGSVAVNTTGMNVNWPSQSWQGLVQNPTTISKVATLNAQIAALGGCGRLIQPTAGVIPANTAVILITSPNFSITANAFGALTQDVYIIFQDNPTVSGGHFGNYNPVSGIRILTISFGPCSDTVSYDRSLLVDAAGFPGAANGASINFSPSGVATYGNLGCVAPVDVFSVEAGNAVSACPGATVSLVGVGLGQTVVSWSSLSGVFSNSSGLSTNFTLPFTASGTILLTLTLTNSCGNSISDIVTVTVSTALTPTFNSVSPICSGDTLLPFPTTSLNGITGVWSPAPDNLLTTTYTFTPDIGQCANNYTTTVTVTNSSVAPDFAPTLLLCSGTVAPILNSTSPNGILGTWLPLTIDNTTDGLYVFTPNAGQCATNFTTTVTITNSNIVPNFAPTLSLCFGTIAPLLNSISPNGIVGTWSPPTIDNTIDDLYVFTPNAGQCATSFTTTVTITNSNIVPDFATALSLCSGTVAPLLNSTSPNGIVGVWLPPIIDNTNNGLYVFTPNSGQCANSFTTTVTISNSNIVPDFATALSLCSGTVAPLLNSTSPNGIVGVWLPPIIDNTNDGLYVFTPNSGQCANSFTTTVTISNSNIVPDFATALSLCSGTVAPLLNSTSPNGIVGTWSPPTIDNVSTGLYVFTPNMGQCATNFTTTVTITNSSIVPNFASALSLCSGTIAPVLNSTSSNGIVGVWSPPSIDNAIDGSYTFTPNVGQCATTSVLVVDITPLSITPIFSSLVPICSGDFLPPLPTISTNGILGTWSPALDNTVTRLYTFLPNPGQCATTTNTTLVVIPRITPDFVSSLNFCAGATVPNLDLISPNGITGTWSPTTINNTISGVYTFQPAAGQCANPVVLSVVISNNQILDKAYALCVDRFGNALFPVEIDSGLSPSEYIFAWTKAGNPLPVTDSFYITTEVNVYQIVATNRITGCTTTIDVNVFGNPPATASAYATADFSDNQQIIVAVTGGLDNFLYQMDDGPFQQSNIFSGAQGGEHTIIVKDSSGCNTIELQVTTLNYPKFFTPNDDGYHDFWNVAGMQPFQRGSILIYDRYGKLVKQLSPYGEGWTGKYNGNPLPADDYWFVVSYQSLSGAYKTFKSHFSLKR